MSLKQKAVYGLIWTFSQQFGVQFINFIVSIVLARLLTPADFGLIGMLTVFISVGTSLKDGGLTSSLIRTKEPDQRDYSTVFVINFIGSVAIYLLLFFCAPFIAAFYDQEILTDLLRVFALSFIIGAFSGVQGTKLTKEMNFKLQMTIQIPSLIGGGILGVSLACLEFGVWSIVYMNLFQTTLSTVQLFLRSNWRPSLIFDRERFKQHLSFGYKLTLSGLLNTVYNNAYNLVIGKFFSPAQLGFYSRANSLKQLPVQNISMALNKVAYPMFASIQDNDVKLKEAYRKLMIQLLYWLAPLMIYLVIVAEPLIRILLGQKWMPAVPYFQILCFEGIMYPLSSYNLSILNVKGRSDLFLRLEILKKIIMTVGITCAVFFGIYGLLYFQLLFSIACFFINTRYSGRMIDYHVAEQLRDILPELVLACLIGAAVYFLDAYLLDKHLQYDISRMVIIGLSYSVLYLGIGYFTKMQAVLDFRKIVTKR